MSIVIRMLGAPRIERDGSWAPPPRGRKAWGVLAHVLLSDAAVSRARLAELLFGDAADPLGALRWTLAELRRALGEPRALRGDPLELGLPAGAQIDVIALRELTPGRAPADLAVGELLEGMTFPASPLFESWLLVARRHVAGTVQATLREAALECLTAGDGGAATALAERMLALDPLDPAAHELVIRCLTRAGRRAAARRQLAASEDALSSVLGAAAPAGLRDAVAEAGAGADVSGDPTTALAQLDAGQAALDAGAVEPGLACLRLAVAEAEATGDDALRGRALSALGAALVHAVRSRDEEGAATLHEGLACAQRAGDRETGVAACRELGYIDVQAGRSASAGGWLARATELARGDDEISAVLGVRGMALSDRAHYGPALELLGESVAAARRCGRDRQAAWSLSLIGRAHLLRDELEQASAAVADSLDLVERERWAAFKPWPEALQAELDLRGGRVRASADRGARAFRLACRLGDPCWEGMTARARALTAAAQGDRALAHQLLADARVRATRVRDPYQWAHAAVLDSLAGVAIRIAAADAPDVVEALARLAARTGMRELVVRAHVHRAALGDPDGMGTARLLAAEIDNPALDRLVAAG